METTNYHESQEKSLLTQEQEELIQSVLIRARWWESDFMDPPVIPKAYPIYWTLSIFFSIVFIGVWWDSVEGGWFSFVFYSIYSTLAVFSCLFPIRGYRRAFEDASRPERIMLKCEALTN